MREFAKHQRFVDERNAQLVRGFFHKTCDVKGMVSAFDLAGSCDQHERQVIADFHVAKRNMMLGHDFIPLIKLSRI